ncbi:hypothetical protein GCM10023078_38290 [Gibbsiella greigii]
MSGRISRDDFLKLPEIKEIRKEDVVFYKNWGGHSTIFLSEIKR